MIFYWAEPHKWNTDMQFPNSKVSMNLLQYNAYSDRKKYNLIMCELK